MILQSTFSPSTPNSLSPTIAYSLSFPFGSHSVIPLRKFRTLNHSIKCSSLPQVCNSSGAVNKKRIPVRIWTRIYKRLRSIEDSELGVASVLDQIEKEGTKLARRQLCRLVRELRRFKRFELALEVYEWMNNRIERFNLSCSDTAIQLNLIAKVHGVSSAEDYFVGIPDTMKDYRIYGALLNAYAGAKERDKAESLMDQLRKKGYAICALPFNVMMSLYMKLDEYDKVDQLISEMKHKNVQLDICSYNIWLSACGSKGSAEGMEHVLEQIKLDSTIKPNWMTLSTMASIYMKLGQPGKARECVINLESRIRGPDNLRYQSLLGLCSTLGKKEEVYRVWSLYKSEFARVPNWGYHVMISALIRFGEIEEAEKCYQEWLEGEPNYDPRIGNRLLGWYVREEPFEKAKCFFDQMIEAGGRPNSGSWEILGEGHTKEGRISDALSCFRKAVSLAEAAKKAWKPRPHYVSAFLELCEKEGDTSSKDEFVDLLRGLGCFQDTTFKSLLAGHMRIEAGDHDDHIMFSSKTDTDDETEETESEESEMLIDY